MTEQPIPTEAPEVRALTDVEFETHLLRQGVLHVARPTKPTSRWRLRRRDRNVAKFVRFLQEQDRT